MTTAQVDAGISPVTSWAQCDRCNKWRRIPKSVADELKDDSPW